MNPTKQKQRLKKKKRNRTQLPSLPKLNSCHWPSLPGFRVLGLRPFNSSFLCLPGDESQNHTSVLTLLCAPKGAPSSPPSCSGPSVPAGDQARTNQPLPLPPGSTQKPVCPVQDPYKVSIDWNTSWWLCLGDPQTPHSGHQIPIGKSQLTPSLKTLKS